MMTIKEANKEIKTALEEWEVKTLLEDIERSGKPLEDVYLPQLSLLNPKFYGTKAAPKFQALRDLISNKLTDLKRRTSTSYLKFVLGYGVIPSQFTTRAAQLVEEATQACIARQQQQQQEQLVAQQQPVAQPPATQPPAQPPATLPPPTLPPPTQPLTHHQQPVADLTSQFRRASVNDADFSFVYEPPHVATPPPPHVNAPIRYHSSGYASPEFSPPRRHLVGDPGYLPEFGPDLGSYGHNNVKVAPGGMTPPRNIVVPSVATVASTNSGSTTGKHKPGSYYNPDISRILVDFSGRYGNNIWVYEEPKMVKLMRKKDSVGKKYSYSGYLIKRKTNLPDVYVNDIEIASEAYINDLSKHGLIDDDEKANCQFLIHRCPYVDSCDRAGKGSIIPIMFPSVESKEAVTKAHAALKNPIPGDTSPSPSWYYSVLIFPHGVVFDNRIFSDHDTTLSLFESTPEKVKVASLGHEEVVVFHTMWRVAIKGSEALMDEEETLDLQERIKRRREAAKKS